MIPRHELKWRTVEWWAAGVAIFIQTGAVVALLADTSAAANTVSRLLFLLSYGLTLVLLVRARNQLRTAFARSAPLSLLLLLPFISALWSISGTITLRRAIALAFSVALAYGLAIRFSPRQLATLVGTVLGGCMLLSLLFAVAFPGLGWMEFGADMRGVFIHKNILGWYAAISVIANAAVLGASSTRWRVFAVAALTASLICLAASGSMTGLLGLSAAGLIALFYVLFARLRGPSRTFVALVLLQLLAIAAISTTELLVPTLEALGRDATLTGRVPLWRLVDPEIGRHLLLGFGYQAFWTQANPAAWTIWMKAGWIAPHAHSGYRDTLLNFGLFGAAIFLMVTIRALIQGVRLSSYAKRDGWLWLNVFFGMFLVMNLTESLLLTQNEFLFVLFATAILMFGLREPELARPESPRHDIRQWGPLTGTTDRGVQFQ